jgi:uracil-DNA glycosylase family 4
VSNVIGWNRLNDQIVACGRCPRLRAHCLRTAEAKRRAYLEWDYWGRPVPNFGVPQAMLLIVGLAPAAHGANRTGRMFTGDNSGLWLYRALHRAGFANQAESTHVCDGLRLIDAAITAIVHCAPPSNKPEPQEVAACQQWLAETLNLVEPRVILALGHLAWRGVVDEALRRGWLSGSRPRFGHGAAVHLDAGRALLGSYHPSQQNTFTGRLTEAMLDAVLQRARELIA